MKEQLQHLAYEVELEPGKELTLPLRLVASVGAGRWIITVQPAVGSPVRGHDAFLNGYATGDEGLYDADSSR